MARFILEPASRVRFTLEEPSSEGKTKGGLLDTIRSYTEGITRAATYEYADEMVAYVRSLVRGTKYEDELKTVRETSERLQKEHPYASAAGYLTGSVIGPGGPAGLGGKATARFIAKQSTPKAIGTSAAIGAGTGGLTSSGAATEGERLASVPAGMVVGGLFGATGEGAGRFFFPQKASVPGVAAAESLKIPLSPGKVAGKGPTRLVEERLLGTPLIGTPIKRRQEAAQGRYNSLTRQLLGGVDSPEPLTRNEIRDYGRNIGRRIQDFEENPAVIVPPSPKVVAAVTDIKLNQGLLTPSMVDKELVALSGEIGERFSKATSGAEIQAILSYLSDKKARVPDKIKRLIGKLEQSIKDSIKGAMPESVRLDYEAARKQYRNYLQLKEALDESTGNIDPMKLSRVMARKRYATDEGPVRGMAQAAPFVNVPEGSKTAEKLFLEKLSPSSILGGAGIAGYAAGMEPTTLATLLSGLTLGLGASRYLASDLATRRAAGQIPRKYRVSPGQMGVLGNQMGVLGNMLSGALVSEPLGGDLYP